MKRKNLFAGAAFGLAILGAFAFKSDDSKKQMTNYYYKIGGGACLDATNCAPAPVTTPCQTGAVTYFESINTPTRCAQPGPTLYKQ